MIAFATAITDSEIYRRCAEPGIKLAAEPDSEVIAMASAGLNNPDGTFHDHKLTGSIFRNYNVILDQVADRDDLEALVLLHQDSEIVDPDFCSRLRQSLADPEVAIVGCAGAIGVRSIAWWEGAVTWASFEHRYTEHGGGRIAGPTWDRDDIPPYGHTGEVDTIDGFVIAMSPWAVRELRFDEGLGQFHGYDFDICLQARAAGKKVVTQDMKVIHHHSLDLIGDLGGWIEAHMKVAEKWDGQVAGVGEAAGDWKQRARRAEAEADAARMLANATELVRNATEDKLAGVTQSASWRITAPLRWLKGLFRRAADPAPSSSSRRAIEVEPFDPQLEDPVLLGPLEDRIAVPARDQSLDLRGPRGVLAPEDAQAEEGRDQREPQPTPLRHEVLDRGQDAVPRTALALRDARVVEPAANHSRIAGGQPDVAGKRLTILLRHLVRDLVGIASGERPTDVVHEQQRQAIRPSRRSAGAH